MSRGRSIARLAIGLALALASFGASTSATVVQGQEAEQFAFGPVVELIDGTATFARVPALSSS
jgi:hypothetical protein